MFIVIHHYFIHKKINFSRTLFKLCKKYCLLCQTNFNSNKTKEKYGK